MSLGEIASKLDDLTGTERMHLDEYGLLLQKARRLVDEARGLHADFPEIFQAEHANFAHHSHVSAVMAQIDAMLHSCQLMTLRTSLTYPHENNGNGNA